ncbi:MAG: DinB family protein [Bacteroidia bacterium]
MNQDFIIKKLQANAETFKSLFAGLNKEEYLWKPQPEKWCLLEIACHLYDEEREDFKARLKHTLENPENKMPSIDPAGWVASRKYIEQDFEKTVNNFLDERNNSLSWLYSLENPNWKNTYQHPKFGEFTAGMFLDNWLAHDYLHIRQITATKYAFLKSHSKERMDYAGEW